MSEPRHAMVFKCAKTDKWFLEINHEPYMCIPKKNGGYFYKRYDSMMYRGDHTQTFGSFDSAEEAQEFGYSNFCNTGYEIPIIRQLKFIIAENAIDQKDEEYFWL